MGCKNSRDASEAEVELPPPKRRKGCRGRCAAPRDVCGQRGAAEREHAPIGKAASVAESISGHDIVGEAWPRFLERAEQQMASAGLPRASEPLALFEVFRTTADLAIVFASFAQLFVLATQDARESSRAGCESPWTASRRSWRFPYEPIRALLGGHWRAKQLWEKLDRRAARPEYAKAPCASGRMAGGKRVVIVGAGPCGLRAAIELCLLGARVTVVERRRDFSRINQLHLWQWCGNEVKALGARCLEPPGLDFGSNPDKLHISISELQVLLLKTALLLGVEIFLGAEFLGVSFASDACCASLGQVPWTGHNGAGTAASAGADLHALAGPSPRAPTLLQNIGALICSDGSSCCVGRALGIGVTEMSCLRAEDAIGLVCNFKPLALADEKALRSFGLARQFYGQLFRELASVTGADLENIVYTKSKRSHYFVMTPTRDCLISTGVIRDASQRPMLTSDNIDRTSLDALVRRVASFPLREAAGEPALADLVAAETGRSLSLEYADSGPQLFDFSKLRRAELGLTFISRPPTASEVREGGDCEQRGLADNALLVALVGDALLEPFWPEGLGIVRGFFSSLDASSAIALWTGGATRGEVQQHFAEAFAQLKSLGAGSRNTVLCPEEGSYGLAPSTRYRVLACGRRLDPQMATA